MVRRPSIRNLVAERDGPDTIFFESSDVSRPGASHPHLNFSGSLDSFKEVPDPAAIEGLVRRVRRTVGLTIFGIDVVLQCETLKMFPLDLNYFPGFKGVENFPDTVARTLAAASRDKDHLQ